MSRQQRKKDDQYFLVQYHEDCELQEKPLARVLSRSAGKTNENQQRQVTITLPNTTGPITAKNTQKQLTAASTPTKTTQLQATAHTPTNTTQKETAPRPTQITQQTTAPRPTQTPQPETPVQRQTQTTEQQPSIVMLNSINLNIEKLIRRQIDFEMCVTRKLDSTNKRIFGIEASLTKMVERLDELKTHGDGGINESLTLEETDVSDEMFGDIPERYRLSVERLRELRNDSTRIGNFGLTLTREFFPELFGPGNQRWEFSWFGGGVKSKNELEPRRKEIIRRYVTAFHPAACKTSVWKDTIVSRINEGLRRKDDKEGSSKKGRVNDTQRASVEIHERQALSTLDVNIQPVLPENDPQSDLHEISYDMTADYSLL